jgi:hypothetical protein
VNLADSKFGLLDRVNELLARPGSNAAASI